MRHFQDLYSIMEADPTSRAQPVQSTSSSHAVSVLDDALFQAFISTLHKNADQNVWTLLTTFQEYPDPKVLLEHQAFAGHVASTEPGRKIDYADLRRKLELAQDDLVGSVEEAQKVFTGCNELVQAHVRYVKATAAVYGYRMFEELIDRFYGAIHDQRFQRYWQSTLTTNQRSWPGYETMKQENARNLNSWAIEQEQASWIIEQLKNSPSTKVLQAKIKSAVERYEARQKRTASVHSQPTSRRYFSSPPYLTSLQRKAAIQQRNSSADHARAARNIRHKQQNLMNDHQLGNQSRICLPDNVIEALARINTSLQKDLFNEDTGGETNDGNQGNGHTAMAGISLDEDEREDKCKKDLGGIVIPEGFVNLCPEIGPSQSG